jgi:hypothetical protein
MPAQIRIPYYRLDFAGFFALQRTWELFDKTRGCKPLNNPQAAILMERKPPPLPGTKPPEAKKAEKPKHEPKAAEKGPEAKKPEPSPSGVAGAQSANAAQPLKVSNAQVKGALPVEVCKPPPPFDMLDLPDAMDKMGFTVAAKLSRRWFNSRKHEIPNDPLYVYPDDMMDTNIVSLDFVLKYPKARTKYEHLIRSAIYNEAATKAIKKKSERCWQRNLLITTLPTQANSMGLLILAATSRNSIATFDSSPKWSATSIRWMGLSV